MAKFYGAIGYVFEEQQEDSPDVFIEKPIERFYKGDLVRNSRSLENSNEINDNVNISNQISIVADPYAFSHMFAMRYVKWMGTAWKVTNVGVEPPRLVLTLGGVYHGEIAQ
ncbi:MAG: hypothetical protein J6U54_19035 [Clostridiales bacterium]|nr:hypothetical protein [Clostridiales bacterium]